MALPREYRIRELYLKFLEENFPSERIAGIVSVLEECEYRLLHHFSRINMDGNGPREDVLFNVYVYSLFDAAVSRRRRVSPLKDLARFSRHFKSKDTGDSVKHQPAVAEALSYCKIHPLLPEEELRRLSLSIALFRDFIKSGSDLQLEPFSDALRTFLLEQVNELLDESTYQQKIRLYGRLIQTTPTDPESATETMRLALQCFPMGNQKSSNTFLYITTKTKGLWPNITPQNLHTPADSDLTRVAARMGLTKRRLTNLEYHGISYAAVQSIARRLRPENPSTLYGLKYIAKIWCKPRAPNCVECPMSEVCEYAQTIIP